LQTPGSATTGSPNIRHRPSMAFFAPRKSAASSAHGYCIGPAKACRSRADLFRDRFARANPPVGPPSPPGPAFPQKKTAHTTRCAARWIQPRKRLPIHDSSATNCRIQAVAPRFGAKLLKPPGLDLLHLPAPPRPCLLIGRRFSCSTPTGIPSGVGRLIKSISHGKSGLRHIMSQLVRAPMAPFKGEIAGRPGAPTRENRPNYKRPFKRSPGLRAIIDSSVLGNPQPAEGRKKSGFERRLWYGLSAA